MPCECCSCCVIDATPTYGVLEVDCVSYCQFAHYSTTGGTEAACESTYDGCLFLGGIFDAPGTVVAFNEEQCGAGTLPPAFCALSLVTDDPAECPDGWVFGTGGCYYESCIDDCANCTTDVPGATVFGCDGESGSPEPHCENVATLTPQYGVWHPKVWYVHCGDYVAPMSLAGPGTELKALLARFGIHATPNCKCNKMAKKMNAWGPDGCLEHIEEIVDVLEEEAGKRRLPFLRSLGRLLVKKAIRHARGQ